MAIKNCIKARHVTFIMIFSCIVLYFWSSIQTVAALSKQPSIFFGLHWCPKIRKSNRCWMQMDRQDCHMC